MAHATTMSSMNWEELRNSSPNVLQQTEQHNWDLSFTNKCYKPIIILLRIHLRHKHMPRVTLMGRGCEVRLPHPLLHANIIHIKIQLMLTPSPCPFYWVINPRPKNRNQFLFLTQLVAVAGGVLIFGGGSYCV